MSVILTWIVFAQVTAPLRYEATITLVDPETSEKQTQIAGTLSLAISQASPLSYRVVKGSLGGLTVLARGREQKLVAHDAFKHEYYVTQDGKTYPLIRRELSEGEGFFEQSLMTLCMVVPPPPGVTKWSMQYQSENGTLDPRWSREIKWVTGSEYEFSFKQEAWPGLRATGTFHLNMKTGSIESLSLTAEPVRIAIDGEKMKALITLKLLNETSRQYH